MSLSRSELADQLGTADADTLITAVRLMLERGLNENFLKNNVRIDGFTPFGGGLKAKTVGGVDVKIQAAAKVGGDDLRRDVDLMRELHRQGYDVLPEIYEILPVGGHSVADPQYMVLMEQLVGHDTLFDMIYRNRIKAQELSQQISRIVQRLDQYFSLDPRRLSVNRSGGSLLNVNPDPFPKRIAERLKPLLAMPRYASLATQEGTIDGVSCPPVFKLIDLLMSANTSMPLDFLRPAHGDLHVKNIMMRRYGRGFRLRFIDPSAAVGISTPYYDFGKLLHFLGPIGWLEADRKVEVSGHLTKRADGWSLTTKIPAALSHRPAEKKRQRAEDTAKSELRTLAGKLDCDEDFDRNIALAEAAANIGLVHLYAQSGEEKGRMDMALACSLKPLLSWYRQMTSLLR